MRREYLVNHGVSPDSIVKVEDGRDTICEAFSAREIAKGLGLRKITLVTSDKHIKRSMFIFRRIFGQDIEIEGSSTPCGDLLDENEENEYLGAVRQFFVRFPETIPTPNLDTWFINHRHLYDEYKRIHDIYHPVGKESQAYMGVRKEIQIGSMPLSSK